LPLSGSLGDSVNGEAVNPARAPGVVERQLAAALLIPWPTSMRENGRPIFDNMFIKQYASLSIVQQPRQRSLPAQEWEIAQILAIMFDQVEGIEDCGSSGLTTGQLLEP
jgi:hypothetical protein